MANILNIAKSGLMAAQVGIDTTGHNIANASTPGFSRQVVVQSTQPSQDGGFAFLGKGTEVIEIKRIYNEYLAQQVRTTQTSQNELSTYHAQIDQINNMFADATVGLSPTLQDFFKGVQDLASDPGSGASRQTMLSSADELASQFQTIGQRFTQMKDDVNTQITASVSSINSYAQQIATLNDAIDKAMSGSDGKPANDLLDQRDQLLSNLSKEIGVTIVKQGNFDQVYVGTGQPLVIGTSAYQLVTTASATDLGKLEVGYQNNGQTITLAESSLAGGTLGGLFNFRANTLEPAQNNIGRIALALGTQFNAQHQLGQDQTGALGGKFFNLGSPLVSASTNNAGNMQLGATITNTNALTTSDYQVQYVGPGNYKVTRLSDGAVTTSATLPMTVDGVSFSTIAGTPTAGDMFLVRPTVNGASGFSVAITDPAKIAAAEPIRMATGSANTGTGAISAVTTNATTVLSAVSLTYNAGGGTLTGFPATLPVSVDHLGVTTTYAAGAAVPYSAGDTVTFGGVEVSGIPAVAGSYNVGPPTATLTYSAAGTTLSGFPSYLDVTVTNNGTSTTYAAGTPVPYTSGATISYGGISFVLSGNPGDNDTYTVGPNIGGVGDNRNALQLASLQTASIIGNSTDSVQSAFGQFVNAIGNKTHELDVTSAAQAQLTQQAVEAQQADSGVNLDEEAANLLRYQQEYQAAGKVMQTASKLFDVLLALGEG
jgi:flagellar hook-associated protein 1 FlgK